MRIQGVLNGQIVEIQQIIPIGLDTFIVYKQMGLDVSATDLQITKKSFNLGGSPVLSLMTSATVVA